jgi:predicted nucleotidyltransferase component of viral defense system
MIQHSEIKNLETEWGLREDVIEKDYVIGWILWGIGSHDALRDAWVFKGGTCLKKCYFETYRFSEDLDFTILPGGPFEPDAVLPILDEILTRIYEEAGIDFAVQQRKMKLRPNGVSSEGRVYYRGPRRAPFAALVKLDLTASEKVIRPPVLRSISHPFSDRFPSEGDIRCYSFDELFAEKIRALGERCRPRDLYDVVNMHRHSGLRNEPKLVLQALVDKCESKGVPVPTHVSLRGSSAFSELESEWENMLAHQLPNLPPHRLYLDALDQFFAWLEERVIVETLPVVPADPSEDVSWSPPPTVFVWGQGIPLEPVRFAGTNHLCVEIYYQKEDGHRVRRTVEPYSLRKTVDGKIILHAFDLDRNGHRTFRVDRLLGVTVTSKPFKPKYQVEFAQTGPIIVRDTRRNTRNSGATRRRGTL